MAMICKAAADGLSEARRVTKQVLDAYPTSEGETTLVVAAGLLSVAILAAADALCEQLAEGQQ